MNNSQFIAEKIKETAKEQKKTITKLINDCNLNKNALYTMQNGYFPRLETLIIIADYLGCSVDYLLGRDIKNSVPDDDIRNAIYEIINNLPDEKRIRLLGYLEALAAE